MEIIISIVTAIFAIFSIIFLWYFGYPFLLRYTIETRVDNIVQSGTNGAAGLNGLHGQNSPDSKHGTHGMNGLSSPSGVDGNNGRNGQNGLSGFKGDEGEHGDNGSEGQDGVPGNNIIFIKEKVFDDLGPTVYYVGGLSVDNHIEESQKNTDNFIRSERTRLLDLLNNMLVKDSDKIKFSQKIKAPNFPYKSSIPPPNAFTLVDLIGVNSFLNTLKQQRLDQKTLLENTKRDSLSLIEENQNNIDQERLTRDAFVKNLSNPVFLLPIRATVIGSTAGYSSRVADLLNELSNATILNETFDTKVNVLLSLLSQQQNILTSPTSTTSEKNAATLEINNLNKEINILKALKDKYNLAISDQRKQIDATYKEDVTDFKRIISEETDKIKNAIGSYDEEIENFIKNYRDNL